MDCVENESSVIEKSSCMCGSISCDVGKFCYDGSCEGSAKGNVFLISRILYYIFVFLL